MSRVSQLSLQKYRKPACMLCVFFCSTLLLAKDVFLVAGQSSKVAQLIDKAKKFEDQKQWNQAIQCYHEIVKDYSCNLIPVTNNLYQNAHRVVVTRLAKLPPQAQQLYRSIILAEIKRHKRDFAVAPASTFPMHLIATREGEQLFLQMVDRLLTQENYQQLLPLLANYLNQERLLFTDDEYPGMLARLYLCYYALGEKYWLLEMKEHFSKWNREQVTLGERKQRVGDFLRTLLERMEERVSIFDEQSTWPIYGNNKARNFIGRQTITNLRHRWSAAIAVPKRKKQKRYFYNERPRAVEGPAPYYPILGDGQVFLSNGKDILAYNLFSSRLEWSYSGLIPKLQSVHHEQVMHSLTYHQGAIYANIEGPTPTQREETWSIYLIRTIIPERKLVKLDAASGRILWMVNAPQQDNEAFANKASFMSAPVVWGKRLYAGATDLTGLFNSYVVAVNPQNGNIEWKTLIGSAQQELNMFGRPVRESVGSVVATGNGRLYYLTNLGACCSVDPISGKVLWVFLYKRLPRPRPNRALFITSYRETSWYNSPVVLTSDAAYFAPLDSNHIYCLDAWSGKKIWSKNRGAHRYLLTVVDGKVILGGDCNNWRKQASVELLDAKSGDRLQVIPLAPGEQVTGMGFVSEKYFYFPSSRYLYGLDYKKRKLAVKFPWPNNKRDSGHIVVNDNVLVTASSKSINTFLDFKDIKKRLQQRVQDQPQFPFAHLKLADFYLQRGGRWLYRAEELYKKSLDLATSKEIHRQICISKASKGLLRIYLLLARQNKAIGDIDTGHKFYQQALKYAQQPATVVSILFENYHYYRHTRQHQKMKECLTKLIARYGERNYYAPDLGVEIAIALYASILLANHYEELEKPQNAVAIYQNIIHHHGGRLYRGISASEWAKRNISRLLEIFGQKIYSSFDAQALLAYQRLQQKPKTELTSGKFLKILQQYPNSKHAALIYLAMIRELIREQKIQDATEYLKSYVRNYHQDPQYLEASLLLIKCYEQLHMYKASKILLHQLQRYYPKHSLTIDKRTIEIEEYVSQKLQLPPYNAILVADPQRLNLWDSDSPKHKFVHYGKKSLRLIKQIGSPAREYEHLLFLNLGSMLYCRNGATAKVQWKRRISWIIRMGFIGKHLFAWSPSQMFSLDPNTGQTLWKTVLPRKLVSVTLGKNSIAVVARGKNVAQSTIMLINPGDGSMRWQKNFPGKDPGDALLGNNALVVWAKNYPGAYIFDTREGKLLHKFSNANSNKPDTWGYYPFVLTHNYLCLVRNERWIECYELDSLKIRWRYDATSIFLHTAVGNESYICFARKNNQFMMLGVADGNVKWNMDIPDNKQIFKVLPDWEIIYILETMGSEEQKISLRAFDVQQGNLQWTTSITKQGMRVNLSTLITHRHLVVLNNRLASQYAQSWQSLLTIYDKFTGKHLKYYEVKKGDRGQTITEICVRAGNLWLIKDNMYWVLGG